MDEKRLIKIGNDFAVGADESCVTVYKKQFNKNKNEHYYTPMWYYGTFTHALHALVDRKLQGLSEFSYLVKEIDKLKAEITEKLDEIKKAVSKRKPAKPEKSKVLPITTKPKKSKKVVKKKKTIANTKDNKKESRAA